MWGNDDKTKLGKHKFGREIAIALANQRVGRYNLGYYILEHYKICVSILMTTRNNICYRPY